MLEPFVSIVINNYNYARFLPAAIESALAQSYPRTEVIVVDDGSTDGSHSVIDRYTDRLLAIEKANGGQASAFDAGLRASRGDLVIFLDADDALLPCAAQRAAERFAGTQPAKVHWPLWVMDGQGHNTWRTWPPRPLPEGDLREVLIRCGPSVLHSPPTSGNAWARSFLEQVLPIPGEYRLCADDYLYALAPAFGSIGRIAEPMGFYRLHGANNYLQKRFEDKVELGLRLYDEQCCALERVFAAADVCVDTAAWRRNSWYHRLQRALRGMAEVIPEGSRIVLVDEDKWGTPPSFAGVQRHSFMERGGRYYGPPADSEAGIAELRRLSAEGARYAVFSWCCFWWLDHYAALGQYLRSQHRLALADDCVAVFELCA